jgi:hypothetical protein
MKTHAQKDIRINGETLNFISKRKKEQQQKQH